MSIKLIANTVWENSSKVITTDAVTLVHIEADTPGVLNLTGGPRHLIWTSSSTSKRWLVYMQGNGGLTCDTLILTRADLQTGRVKILYWSEPYGTGGSMHQDFNPFTETLVGPRSQDWVYEFSSALTTKYAIGIELAATYSKTVGKLILGTALTFSNPASAAFRPFQSSVTAGKHTYLVEHEAAFEFQSVSRANVQTLERLYKKREEPVCFYDSSGYTIAEKLWHGLITDLIITPTFDDKHTVSIRTARLRHYA